MNIEKMFFSKTWIFMSYWNWSWSFLIEISTFDGENIRLDWSDELPDPTFKTLDFIYDPENFEEDGKNPLISSCFELIYPKR